VYPTLQILHHFNESIENKSPFSIIRFGDAVLGILSVFLAPDVLSVGKWHGAKGKRMANNILGQLTVPNKMRRKLCLRMVTAANRCDYLDSYDAYKLIRSRRLGILARSWKQIHKAVGIDNTSYCSCFVHYFSIVYDEYNLFDIMKDRRIFCITSREMCIDNLKTKSNAAEIDFYRIPRRGRKAMHYRKHFQKVMQICKSHANNYDFFLIGGGFLGKLYCDQVKRFGGRAFDAGRLFDFWSQARIIDSAPKRFLQYDPKLMLCHRLKTPKKGDGVW
jgi:hypothetical protein